jgi:NADH-quinone oxidoreductase subunit C
MNKFEEIVAFVRQHCGQSVDIDEAMTPRGVRIQASDLHKVCEKLHEDPAMYFDMLSCVTAVDNGVEAGTIDIVYNLYSIPFNSHFTLKVVVSREQPELDTVSELARARSLGLTRR